MYDAYQTSAEIKSHDPTIVNPYAKNLSATLEASLSLLYVHKQSAAAVACDVPPSLVMCGVACLTARARLQRR